MTLFNRLFAGAFAPLQNRNYRIYVTGQAISLIGTFMQQVALQWLIWDITHDTRWTGVVNALLFVPMFFLGPFSGAVADRVDRRKLLIATQVIEMLLAFALAALVAGGLHSIGPVLVIALIAGITTSFNFAATWAFVGRPNPVLRSWNLKVRWRNRGRMARPVRSHPSPRPSPR